MIYGTLELCVGDRAAFRTWDGDSVAHGAALAELQAAAAAARHRAGTGPARRRRRGDKRLT